MSSSDDDAPEDVSFVRSKEDALNNIRTIKDVLIREKEERKQLQLTHELRNLEQKKHKALPLEVLQQADDVIKEKEARKRKLNEAVDHLEAGENETNDDDNEDDVYVTIAKTKLFKKKPETSTAEFKQKHFYSGRIRRIDSKQNKQQKSKRLFKS